MNTPTTENKTAALVDRFIDTNTEQTLLCLDDYEDITEAVIALKHPISGAATDMTVIIAGPEHPSRKRLVQARQRRMRRELEKSGQIKLNDPTEDDQDELELLIACTLGWSNLRTRDGVIEFTPANVAALYADPTKRWVRSQVRAKMDEVELFIRRSEIV